MSCRSLEAVSLFGLIAWCDLEGDSPEAVGTRSVLLSLAEPWAWLRNVRKEEAILPRQGTPPRPVPGPSLSLAGSRSAGPAVLPLPM